jgi:cation:H+ antiporter
VIAATLVAFGTSLPELVVGITSVLKGHKEILVGNVIGADILNVLFVVGASATAAPLPILDPEAKIPRILLYVHVPTMLLILVLFRLFIMRATRQGSFQRWYGVPLVLIYVGYTVLQYLVS